MSFCRLRPSSVWKSAARYSSTYSLSANMCLRQSTSNSALWRKSAKNLMDRYALSANICLQQSAANSDPCRKPARCSIDRIIRRVAGDVYAVLLVLLLGPEHLTSCEEQSNAMPAPLNCPHSLEMQGPKLCMRAFKCRDILLPLQGR